MGDLREISDYHRVHLIWIKGFDHSFLSSYIKNNQKIEKSSAGR